MLCPSCREQQHYDCPGVKNPGQYKNTGLSVESANLQRAALCTCQHRMPLVSTIEEVETKMIEGVV